MHEEYFASINSAPLRSIFEKAKATAMQVMDADGYVLYVNEAFTHAFGYTNNDIRGKHCRILFTEEDRKRLVPEMEIAHVKQHGASADRNYIIHKDGSCVWVTGESMQVENGKDQTFLFKVIQSIHEQKLLEKFLKESQEFSDNVVGSISDALVVIDIQAKILKVNYAFYNFFGIQQSSVEGISLFELNDPFWSPDQWNPQLQQVIETEASSEFEMQWPNGPETKHLFIKARLLDGKMVDKKILLVFTDVTDKVRSEQQRDDLIGFVIHELRNPLGNISLCNELMEQELEEKDWNGVAELLNKTKQNTERLNKLIRELFDATKAGAGTMQFFKSPFNFEEGIKEAIEAIQMTHPSHTIIQEGKADIQVHADRNRIIQVVSNFLINAIKYSPGANKVKVVLFVENGHACVQVTDYGEGIAASKIPHIFNRYYRADKRAKADGLGLGLYLSKQIIDAHNGRVWIESKEGEGSSFYFSIPV